MEERYPIWRGTVKGTINGGNNFTRILEVSAPNAEEAKELMKSIAMENTQFKHGIDKILEVSNLRTIVEDLRSTRQD